MTDVHDIVVSAEVVEIVEPGPQGPQGRSPNRSLYDSASISSVGGVLHIDFAAGQSFLVDLHEHVTSVVFDNLPSPGKSQGVELYLQQDEVGGWTVAWPEARWPGAVPGELSTDPLSLDIAVVKRAFGIFFITIVGRQYGEP
ncbi:MAG: hypothetical protein U1E62_21790 [Alsobacter sp.]